MPERRVTTYSIFSSERRHAAPSKAIYLARMLIRAKLYHLVPDTVDLASIDSKSVLTAESKFAEREATYTTTVWNSSTIEKPAEVKGDEASLRLPSGWLAHISRSNTDTGKSSGDAVINLEDLSTGIHVGRTFYAIGDVAVVGAEKLRCKTDLDFNFLSDFANSYQKSEHPDPTFSPVPLHAVPVFKDRVLVPAKSN